MYGTKPSSSSGSQHSFSTISLSISVNFSPRKDKKNEKMRFYEKLTIEI